MLSGYLIDQFFSLLSLISITINAGANEHNCQFDLQSVFIFEVLPLSIFKLVKYKGET